MDELARQLHALYTSTDNRQRAIANDWLQRFQKTPEAWTAAGSILAGDGALEPKLFAAQTFRSKISYDIQDLQVNDRLALRDSLLGALRVNAPSGQRVFIRQICLALADLLLQLPEWTNGVGDMITFFGQQADMASALLEFLTVLPEESASNGRIDPTNNDVLTRENANQVIALLSLYISAPGISPALRKQTLVCLSAWLRSGGVQAEVVGASPLFDAAFQALATHELFDEAVDIICDLIHETQEVQDNVNVIQKIVPHLIQLTPLIAAAKDDTDRIKGFTKVLCEAGEWYVPLMLQHQATFLPIVQAIGQCAQCEDLEVVEVTFSFWFRLSKGLQKTKDDPSNQPFLQVFFTLVDTIFLHLRYPEDESTWSAQERDDFREFRHRIGDNLKDCCGVLGGNACLRRAYDAIMLEVGKGSTARWQNIEAPLFAMRSMGAKIDASDDEILPEVMSCLPKLPGHPKIRYAAILVISRYTEWTNQHPDLIPFQLEHVSAGFGDADNKVWLASAMAMQFLCKDCGQHLIPYLPQLHAFVQDIGSRLPADDLLAVTEGIANIIARMEPTEALKTLSLFCKPILEQLLRIATKPDVVDTPTLSLLITALDQLKMYADTCRSLSAHLPNQCAETGAEAWSILQQVMKRFTSRNMSEAVCALMRSSIDFFGRLLVPVVPQILEALSTAFEKTGQSGFLWISGSLAYLASEDPQTKIMMQKAFDNESRVVFDLIPPDHVADFEDVIEDYIGLVRSLYRRLPDMLLLSPNLKPSLGIAAKALSLYNADVIHLAIDYILDIIGHEALAPQPPIGLANGQDHATNIRVSVLGNGQTLVTGLILGIVVEFDETTTAITALRLFAERFPAEFPAWVNNGMSSLPANALSQQDTQKFITDFQDAMSRGSLPAVREAFNGLDRASRKSKARSWEEAREAKRLGMPALESLG